MGYPPKVDIRHHKNPSMAQCEGCDALPINATRERVRQHVTKTGHTAWVVVEHETSYRPKPKEEQ